MAPRLQFEGIVGISGLSATAYRALGTYWVFNPLPIQQDGPQDDLPLLGIVWGAVDNNIGYFALLHPDGTYEGVGSEDGLTDAFCVNAVNTFSSRSIVTVTDGSDMSEWITTVGLTEI